MKETDIKIGKKKKETKVCWIRSPEICHIILGGSLQLSSVTQWCQTLCDPMDCSTPGSPVHHQLPELTQTHVIELVMPSSHLIFFYPLFLLPSIFPNIRIVFNESVLHIRQPTCYPGSFKVVKSCLASCLTLCNPMDCSQSSLLCPWNFPGKNIGVGCHFLLQGIFPRQWLNPDLWHYR